MRIDDLDVKHGRARVNGIDMHYVEKGQGPLLVLLHGFPEMWWSWRYQIEPFANAGYRVVAPDMRGYNDTDARGPYDLDTLAGDIRALIEHLGAQRATVIAHDWGGAVAWHFAATIPDKIERLVVMNCPHPVLLQRALRGNLRQIRRSWYMFLFQLPALPELLFTRNGGEAVVRSMRGMAVDKSNFGDAEMQPMRDAVLKPGRATGMINYYRTALRQGLRDRKMAERYPAIRAPTLLVWAMDDQALGYEDVVPGTERFVSDLTVHRIEGCGHFVQQEQPDEVNRAVLAFLRERHVATAEA